VINPNRVKMQSNQSHWGVPAANKELEEGKVAYSPTVMHGGGNHVDIYGDTQMGLVGEPLSLATFRLNASPAKVATAPIPLMAPQGHGSLPRQAEGTLSRSKSINRALVRAPAPLAAIKTEDGGHAQGQEECKALPIPAGVYAMIKLEHYPPYLVKEEDGCRQGPSKGKRLPSPDHRSRYTVGRVLATGMIGVVYYARDA
jgi:hypothetical protein